MMARRYTNYTEVDGNKLEFLDGNYNQAKSAMHLRAFAPPSSKTYQIANLVGGFNPSEDTSQIGSFPQVGVNIKKYLKPPPRKYSGKTPL